MGHGGPPTSQEPPVAHLRAVCGMSQGVTIQQAANNVLDDANCMLHANWPLPISAGTWCAGMHRQESLEVLDVMHKPKLWWL